MIEVTQATTAKLYSVDIQVAPYDRRWDVPEEPPQTPEKPGGRERSRCTGFAVGSSDASIGACEVSVQRGN